MTSPTTRTLKYLRDNGYVCQVVEKFNPYVNHRIDLFGAIDIVAIKDGEKGVLGVQCTSSSNFSSHLKKILSINELKLWLQCGNKILLQGWSKNSKGRYVLKENYIKIEDFKV